VDGGVAHGPVSVGKVVRLDGHGGAAPDGFLEGAVGVLHVKRDVAHAVAVALDVLGSRVLRRERRGQHEADLALAEEVGRPVAQARLEAGVGCLREAVRLAVEVRGLPGIADPEFHVVDALEPERVRVHVGAPSP
jgi:hypothetical protein